MVEFTPQLPQVLEVLVEAVHPRHLVTMQTLEPQEQLTLVAVEALALVELANTTAMVLQVALA